ncbi:MAG: hypothetical protein A2252_12760 [Elusimicrobia bacterium RIFOXYA2_FULL_39_19]|nr:MAG: hypothetical protein A2252_12760 [Elusimicrobia bacterium RIFOXYA2_FULL_39_19]
MNNNNPFWHLVEQLFGPGIRFFHNHGIFGGWFPTIILWLGIYFTTFYKRPKNKKLKLWSDIYWIIITILMTLFSIWAQIAMII